MAEIGQFTNDIRFIEGKANICADMLSRPFNVPLGDAYQLPDPIAAVGHSSVAEKVAPLAIDAIDLDEVSLETFSPENIEKEQKTCSDCLSHKEGKLPKYVNMSEIKFPLGFTLYCEISGNKARPLLPKSLRNRVLKSLHSIDHCGQKELLRRTASEYYWPNQSTDISEFCKKCHPCALAKSGKSIKTPLTQIKVPDKRFSYLNLDIVGPLPKSNGYRYLFTILDRTSRYFQAVPLVSADAESCCRAFLHHWLSIFSLPARAFSDNGNTFISQIWRGLQEHLGIKVEFTPLFRPQANGAVERQHQSLKNSLKAALIDMGDTHREKWYDALPWVLMGRRAAFQEELGCSPYQLTFGQSPILPGALVADPGPPLTKPQLQELLHALESQSDRPAVQMSNHSTNVKTYTKDIEEATHVYLRSDNPQGLQARFHGPYPINKRTGDSTIEVRTGTFKNGQPRLELHSWHNAKPACLSKDTAIAERPKLGRPSNSPPTVADSAVPPPSPTVDAKLTPPPAPTDAVKPVPSKTKPADRVPAPSTHNMNLRQRK